MHITMSARNSFDVHFHNKFDLPRSPTVFWKRKPRIFEAGMVKSGMQDHLYGHRDVMIAGMQHGTQVHHYLHAGK